MDFQPLDKDLPRLGVEAIRPGELQSFVYEFTGREIEIEITSEEFTSLSPYSGLPDFGTVTIRYQPGELCLELRALKYYLLSYRQVGIYYENAVNRILDDLVEHLKPKSLAVEIAFTIRGGLRTKVSAAYRTGN